MQKGAAAQLNAAAVAAEVPLELLSIAAHCLQLVPSAYVTLSTSKLQV
jgi:hypothetical protein